MTTKTKIIHLHLKEPFNGESDYYFGSLMAIYGLVPAELLGIGYKSLTNALRGRERYENNRIAIHVSTLHRNPNANTSVTEEVAPGIFKTTPPYTTRNYRISSMTQEAKTIITKADFSSGDNHNE